MANLFVRSTDGSNLDNGSTWALAKADSNATDGVTSVNVAGDTIYYSSSHVESFAASISYDFKGTNDVPCKILSVDDTGDPTNPTTLQAGARLASTTASASIKGAHYCYGISIEGYTGVYINAEGQGNYKTAIYENCTFKITQGGATSRSMSIGVSDGASGARYILNDCTISKATAQQSIYIKTGEVLFDNFKLDAGSAQPTEVIGGLGSSVRSIATCKVINSDLSGYATNVNLIKYAGNGTFTISDCKLPAGWTGLIALNRPSAPGCRAEMYNCDDGATHYNYGIVDYAGDIIEETTLVKTGGATDGSQAVSTKMTTTANANEEVAFLATNEFIVPQSNVGTAITVRVPFLHDSVTALNDSEIWLEVSASSDSTSPLYTTVSNKRSDILTTPTDHPASSDTFTTTGMTNPMVQDLSVTLTPQIEGKLYCKVYLAKPSYTIYLDENAVIT